MDILLPNVVIDSTVEMPHRTILTKTKVVLAVHPNAKEATKVTKEVTKVIKEVTKGGTKVMVVEVDLGRSSMSFVGGGMSPANVGMKPNIGLVATLVVTTPPQNVGSLIRSFKCHRQC